MPITFVSSWMSLVWDVSISILFPSQPLLKRCQDTQCCTATTNAWFSFTKIMSSSYNALLSYLACGSWNIVQSFLLAYFDNLPDVITLFHTCILYDWAAPDDTESCFILGLAVPEGFDVRFLLTPCQQLSYRVNVDSGISSAVPVHHSVLTLYKSRGILQGDQLVWSHRCRACFPNCHNVSSNLHAYT